MRRLFHLSLLLLLPTLAEAQVTQLVLGVGRISMDVAKPTLAETQAQVYKLYAPPTATTGVVLTVTCTGTSSPFACTFPIAVIPIPPTGTIAFAVSASITAADGTQESAKTSAPFVLGRAATPAAPQAGMSILPAP